MTAAHRRAARLLVAAAVLLTPAFLSPTAAQAQDLTTTVRTFLSNENQGGGPSNNFVSNTGNDFTGTTAQAFTTGSHGADIVPRKLTLWFGFGTQNNVSSSHLTVAIRRDGTGGPAAAGGDPSEPYITFTNPSNVGGAGAKEFSYDGALSLEASTTYHIMVSYNRMPSDRALAVQQRTGAGSNTPASESLTGWSIGSLRRGADGSWTTITIQNPRLRFKLEGVRGPIAATGAPVITPTGAPSVGSALMAATGDVDDDNGLPASDSDYDWKWQRADTQNAAEADWTDIPNADQATYTPVAEDMDKHLRAVVLFTDIDGYDEARASAGSAAVLAAALAVVTVAVPDGGDRVNGGQDVVFVFSRTVTAGTLQVMVSYSGSSALASSGPTTVNFTAGEGEETLTLASTTSLVEGDSALGVTLTLQMNAAYTLGDPSSATVHVRPPNTAADGRPVIPGTPRAGVALAPTLGNLSDGDGVGTDPASQEFSWQWELEDPPGTWTPIAGADSRAYTPATGDEGKRLRVTVSFIDGARHDEMRTSLATAAVGAANIPATGRPRVTGTPRVGTTLMASLGNVDDEDGLPMGASAFSYRWQRKIGQQGAWMDIPGATGTSYLLVSADRGTGNTSVRVVLSFTDNKNSREEVFGAQSWRVEPSTIPEVSLSVEDATVVGDGTNEVVFLLTWSGSIATSGPLQYDLVDTYDVVNGGAREGADKTWTLTQQTGPLRVPLPTRMLRPGDPDREVTFTLRSSNGYVVGVVGGVTATATVTAPMPTGPVVTVMSEPTDGVYTTTGEDVVFVLSRTADPAAALRAVVAWRGTAGLADTSPSTTVDFEAGSATARVELAAAALERGGDQHTVRLTVQEDAAYTVGNPSSASVIVRPMNSRAVGDAGITGTAEVGLTLTANMGNISDGDGVPEFFTPTWYWQWEDSSGAWRDIPDENSNTYVVRAANAGRRLRVELRWTGGYGYDEARPSRPTARVPIPPGAAEPMITVAVDVASLPGGRPAVFTLTRTGSTIAELTVMITVTGNEWVFVSPRNLPRTATFMVDHDTVPVSISTEPLEDDPENITLTIRDGTGYTVGMSPGNMAVVRSTPAPRTMTLAYAAGHGYSTGAGGLPIMEEGNSIDFVLTLNMAAGEAFTARYTLTNTVCNHDDNSNLVSAADIQGGVTGEVPWMIGETEKTVTITSIRDGILDEPDEWICMDLSRTPSVPARAYKFDAIQAKAVRLNNVATPVVTARAAAASVVGGEDAVFTLTRTGNPAAELMVDITVSGAGALASEITAKTSATFRANSETAEVSVETNAIASGGTNQSVTLTVTDGAAYDVGTPGMATVMVTAPPIPEVTVAAKAGGESVVGGSAGPAVFTLTRSVSSNAALPVTFAISGTHSVSNPPSSASIPANMTEVDVSVPTTAITGMSQTVILTVQPDSGNAYTVGAANMATVTVTALASMPTPPTVTVAAKTGGGSVVGGSAGPAVFTLTRSVSSNAALPVTFAISGTHSVSNPPSSASIPANMTMVDVSVPTTAITGISQTVILTVQPDSGNAYTVGTANMATVTVTAPPIPEVTVAAQAASVVGGSAGPAVFTLTRSVSSATALPVTFAITGTHSVSSPPTSMAIPAMMTTVNVSIPTTAITGGDETVILTVQPDSGNAYTVGTANMATVMVTAPPIPEITVAAQAPSVLGGEDAVFTLTRTEDLAAALMVDITVSGDGALASEITAKTEATFAANSATAEVSVETNEIMIGGTDQEVTLTVDDGAAYDVGTPGMATVMVTAPPTPEITVAAQEESVAGGDHAVFTLTRTEDLAAALMVDITVSGDGALASEITAKTSATFRANSATAEVSVGTNTIEEGEDNQTVTLTVDDGAMYDLGTPASATVTVTSFDADAQSARVSEATDQSLALLAPNVAAGTVQVLTARFDSMAAGGIGASSTANLGGRPLGAFANSSASAAELTREVAGLFGLRLPAHTAADAAGAAPGGSPTTGAPGAAYTSPVAFEAQGTAAHTLGAHSADAQVGRGRGANSTDDWRAFEPGSLHSPDLRSLIAQSGFSVQLGAAHGAHGSASGGPSWTVWGRGSAGGFEGTEKDSALSVEGESVSAYLGADVQLGHLALGLAVGQSSGELDYADTAGDDSGELETELTSVHPYLHWTLRENMSVYAMLGYGIGEATLEDEGFGASLDSDLAMQMLAVGMRRALAASTEKRRFDVKLDAFWVDIESDGASQGNRRWAAVDSQSSRLRLALAGALPLLQGGNAGELLAQGELAARMDGGDAQTGVGAEVGAGLTWRRGGVLLAAEGRVLLVHSENEFEDYEEWGASIEASYRAGGAMGRGLRFTLSPAWGDVQSGVDALYESAGALRELGGDAGRRQRSSDRLLPDRLDFELGYGLSALGGRAELLPFGRFSLAGDDSETRLRLGTRVGLPQRAGDALAVHRLGFEFFGEIQAGEAREQRVGLELNLGF